MSKLLSETSIKRLLLIHELILLLASILLFFFKFYQINLYLRILSYYCMIAMGLFFIILPSNQHGQNFYQRYDKKIFGATLIILIILKSIDNWASKI